MSQDRESKKLVFSIIEFLDSEHRRPGTTVDQRESLEVAMQCLETAYGITINSTDFKPTKTLRQAYGQLTSNSQSATNGATNSTFPDDPSRYQSVTSVPLGEGYPMPAPASAENKKKGDEFKDSGNQYMKENLYEEALHVYNKAIALDGRNAIYFCNRSAAFLKINEMDKALRDCQIAVQLQPDYARAWGRMGVIYSNLGSHEHAFACYKKAADLDPGNESYSNNLNVAYAIIRNGGGGSREESPAHTGAPFNPSLNFGGGIQSILQNPQLMGMATQMLQDPAMQNMMRSLVSNYQNGASAQGAPGFDQLLEMGHAIATQLTETSPNSVEQILNEIRRHQGGPNDQNPPQPPNAE